MTVSAAQLEEQLDRARSKVGDPRLGLFGPSSLVWRINREQMIFLAGGRAALLQEAHPYVSEGIDQHSRTRSDPRGRFRRTFHHVYAMVFGDLDSALRAARRVHAVHERIRGTVRADAGAFSAGHAYAANTEHALLWVHATLWESSVRVFELIFRPLSREEKERYYQETKLFAYLFGITDAQLPPDWPSFLAYNRAMWASDQLHVTEAAREMARFLLASPHPALSQTMRWYRTITAGLLPARLRAAYGLRFGTLERVLFDASVQALRAGIRVTPLRVRFIPA